MTNRPNEGKQLEAAAKAAAKKVFDFSTGQHSVDFTLHVRGDVAKSDDHEQVVAQSACAYTLLAAALDKLNLATQSVVVDLVREVQAMDEKSRKALRDGVKSQTENAMRDLGLEVKKVVSGQTRFANLEVSLSMPEDETLLKK